MHKNATKCNETQRKWCKNKHGSSKIIDTLETYQYFKTRTGAVKKVTAPKPPAHGTKVINTDEELAHLIDVSIASKYGSDMVDATRTITQLASKFDEFKEQFKKEIENSLPQIIRSLMYENSGKTPIPPENSPFINLHSNTHTPGASASAMQPQIVVNSN
jgi:hypothetical protein